MVAKIAVGTGMVAVCVNAGEARINVAVGVVIEGLHAHRLSSRMIETSSLDFSIRLTFISIPLKPPSDFTFQPVC